MNIDIAGNWRANRISRKKRHQDNNPGGRGVSRIHFFTVKILEYAAPTEACPDCGMVCKRHARAFRFPEDISLVVLLQIIVGVYIDSIRSLVRPKIT
jgi:hypothetical protein